MRQNLALGFWPPGPVHAPLHRPVASFELKSKTILNVVLSGCGQVLSRPLGLLIQGSVAARLK